MTTNAADRAVPDRPQVPAQSRRPRRLAELAGARPRRHRPRHARPVGETRVVATFVEGVCVHEAPGLDGWGDDPVVGRPPGARPDDV